MTLRPCRIFGMVCFLVATAASQAQDARELLAAADQIYRNASGFSVEVESRITTSYSPRVAAEGDGAPSRMTRTMYRRMVFKTNRPDDFFWGMQSYSAPASGAPSSSIMGGVGTWSYLSKFGNRLPKQGSIVSGQYGVRDLSEDQFRTYFSMRVAQRGGMDPVLQYFVDAQSGGGFGRAGQELNLLELGSPELVGRPDETGSLGYHIKGRTRMGTVVHLWIEKGTFLVSRIVYRALPSAMPTGGPGAFIAPGSVVETLYKNQRIDPKLMNGDFTVPNSPPSAFASAEEMGFGSIEDTLKLAGMSFETQGPTGAPPVVDGAQQPVAPAAEPETQALSQDQMSAIVLIEGDSGSGTGFMTKIRDVDFVVTNLHVISGNKKFTLKTLRGEEIPVLGIFGAVGADIAIIRITKAQGELKLATDVFQNSKIGDKVAVVGNRRGGGVATQTMGTIKGVGPGLVEVDANFQPGNSGSPIVNLSTGEVVGVATYSQTRRVEVDIPVSPASGGTRVGAPATQIEKRWFGYRIDSVSKWEAIDMARWNEQRERIAKFTELSEAIVAVLRRDLSTARQHPRLSNIISNFETRIQSGGNNQITAASEVKDMFRVIRTLADDGVRDLTNGNYYDFFRTCQYWEFSIPAQLEYRKDIADVLKKYEANTAAYLSRLRSGG